MAQPNYNARLNQPLYAWNRGLISPLALARLDVDRVALSAETYYNWMPKLLGSTSLRGGLGYIFSTYNNQKAVYLNFIYALSDQATLEMTNNAMRIIIDDVVLTRPAVTSAIANGTFDSALTSWTDADESGAVSQWVTGGYMGLTGTGANAAIRTQTVTVVEANIEHGVRVKINRGVVKFKIGSTSGGEEYVTEATLREGEFSFAFTPTAGSFYISVSSTTTYESRVDSITMESAGAVVIPTAWAEANLPYIRYDQSGDILYVACDGIKQYKIERRATRSWGIAEYLCEDGPFRAANITPTTIAASAISGDITLTASKNIFKPTSVGALYRITATGQTVSSSIAAQNTFTSSIRVTGVTSSRTFTVNISGTWVATVSLQRSIGDENNWEDTGTTYAANTVTTFSDGLDNQIVYYRLGVKTGNYTSGTVVASLTYSLGSNAGIARITAYTSPTVVSALVLEDLGGTAAVDNWEEGSWSPRRGYPSAVTFAESRLFWAGKDNIYGSVSDAFESFDDTIEGDSAPIIRSLGSGPVDRINWLLPLTRLVAGAEISEKSIRSNSLDEPLTATVFTIRTPSTKGSSPLAAVKGDNSGYFVRNNRLFELEYDGSIFDYKTVDLTSAVPEIGNGGFIKIAIQRYPDTRIHCIKSDGTAAILIVDRNEDLKCWVNVETDGVIEDVVIKPATIGSIEDSVYYTVKRTINGSDVRYHEKWALDSECIGGTQNKQADSFIAGTQASSATIAGLSHLEGEEVIVWADGVNYSPRVNGVQTTYTVSSGSVTIPTAITSYVVGLPYKARYKSTKLAYGAKSVTALLQSKRIEQIGVIMNNTHNRGLRYGRDFDNLSEMPLYEQGREIGADEVWAEYDERPFEFEQEFSTDSRLCLEAMAPMPCTLLALVMVMQTNSKL